MLNVFGTWVIEGLMNLKGTTEETPLVVTPMATFGMIWVLIILTLLFPCTSYELLNSNFELVHNETYLMNDVLYVSFNDDQVYFNARQQIGIDYTP